MNERIRKLVGQAKFMAEESINRKISANHELYAFAEKLAELIAKDCADLCDRFQERNVGMQPAECAGAIRKLFGVE